MTAKTLAQHDELMKKTETMSILLETNKSLREERDKMEQELQQTQAKVSLTDDLNLTFSSSALEISFSSFVHYNHSIIQILQVFKFDVDNTHEKSVILFSL